MFVLLLRVHLERLNFKVVPQGGVNDLVEKTKFKPHFERPAAPDHLVTYKKKLMSLETLHRV